ncbi:MAG: transporter permease [Rhodospirillales bacterium]|nr:transporter permease [Rhodospirillales bacterium]
MLRHYLIAALRNLARNKLYAAINIVGLAVGFAAALMIALFVRHETSYDAWLPNASSTYLLAMSATPTGGVPENMLETPADLPAQMKLDMPAIELIARMERQRLAVRHGDFEASERTVFWADPNIFALLQLPVFVGDLSTALDQPGSVVITRKMARKYFGKDDAIGETLELDRTNIVKVTAVLQDLPSNTNLDTEFIISGRSAFSDLTRLDTRADCPACFEDDVSTYVRLKPGAVIGVLQDAMPVFLERHKHAALALMATRQLRLSMSFVPLAALHTRPELAEYMKPAADPTILYAISGIGLLIILAASINFINLMTARAARRSVEIGIRKVSGARRRDLVVQFIGEAILYVLLGAILAVALVELLLPLLGVFLNATIIFDWWRQPALIAVIVGCVVVVGVLAGSYPAFLLSSFRPTSVLKSGSLSVTGAPPVRQILVVVQFTILIGLIVAMIVISHQTSYALNEGMRLNLDQRMELDTAASRTIPGSTCGQPFRDAVAALPGVKASACSGPFMNGFQDFHLEVITEKGTKIDAAYLPIDYGFFELYGLRPLAGRFFSREHPADAVPVDDNNQSVWQAPIIINETAVRAFGFTSAADSIGKSVTADGGRPGNHPSTIIGVVPDMALDTIHTAILPEIFFVDVKQLVVLFITLDGRNIPETLARIDRLWSEIGAPRPLRHTFMNEWVQRYYQDVIRQSRLVTAFAGVALFIAGLGLFGLSAFTAERRTKEIGIRKAMGANRFDIMKLLVWQFAKPVLWANLIAWPVAWYFMNRWLHGFAAHVELQLWIFAAATGIALAIALATVSAHAFRVASARPVAALRHE